MEITMAAVNSTRYVHDRILHKTLHKADRPMDGYTWR